MANGSNLEVYLDLQAHPIGSQRGESFGMPINFAIPPARVYVVNHSRTRKWKKLLVPVSHLRGAEEALIQDKELAKVYNVDTLVRAAEKRDMSRYRTDLFPVGLKLRIPGTPDGKGGCEQSHDLIIPPAPEAETKPIMVEVPEGTWDLYLGNYERMRSEDPHVVQDEKQRLAHAWSRRHNPVFAYTDDGVTTSLENPHGFLEFVRVTQRAVLEPVDRAYLTSLDLVEAM